MPDKFVLFETFPREVNAYIVKTRLAAAGIYSFVADGHTNAMYPGMTGVRLFVREKDLDKIRNVLQENNEPLDQENEYLCSECGATLSQEDKFCPNCGEELDKEPDEEAALQQTDDEELVPTETDEDVPEDEAEPAARTPEIKEASAVTPILKGIGMVAVAVVLIMAGRYGFTEYKAAGYRHACNGGSVNGCKALNRLLGGTYLVLGVDIDKAVNDALAEEAKELSASLDNWHIPVKSISTTAANTIDLTLSHVNDTDRLLAAIREDFPDLKKLAASRPPFFVFSFTDSELPRLKATLLSQTVECIRNRTKQSGVTGAIVRPQGDKRIFVDLPGIKAQAGLIDIISRTGQLRFMLVVDMPEFLVRIIKKSKQQQQDSGLITLTAADRLTKKAKRLPDGIYTGTRPTLLPSGETVDSPYLWSHNKELLERFLADKVPSRYMVGYLVNRDNTTNSATYQTYIFDRKNASMTGGILADARMEIGGAYAQPYVSIRFNAQGAKLFGRFTAAHVGRRLAIVLDDTVYSAPTIRERISGGVAQITGDFTENDAKSLATVLRTGALPAPVKLLREEWGSKPGN